MTTRPRSEEHAEAASSLALLMRVNVVSPPAVKRQRTETESYPNTSHLRNMAVGGRLGELQGRYSQQQQLQQQQQQQQGYVIPNGNSNSSVDDLGVPGRSASPATAFLETSAISLLTQRVELKKDSASDKAAAETIHQRSTNKRNSTSAVSGYRYVGSSSGGSAAQTSPAEQQIALSRSTQLLGSSRSTSPRLLDNIGGDSAIKDSTRPTMTVDIADQPRSDRKISRQEKNRQSAALSRQRKKEQMQTLVDDLAAEKELNARLFAASMTADRALNESHSSLELLGIENKRLRCLLTSLGRDPDTGRPESHLATSYSGGPVNSTTEHAIHRLPLAEQFRDLPAPALLETPRQTQLSGRRQNHSEHSYGSGMRQQSGGIFSNDDMGRLVPDPHVDANAPDRQVGYSSYAHSSAAASARTYDPYRSSAVSSFPSADPAPDPRILVDHLEGTPAEFDQLLASLLASGESDDMLL